MEKSVWRKTYIGIILSVYLGISATTAQVVVLKQTSSFFKANSYLLYDPLSKEAAFFDVAEHVDSLTSIIKKKKLKLKYIFLTHAHPDHTYGVPGLMKSFPKAKLALSQIEYDDMHQVYANWEENYPPEMMSMLKNKPEALKLINMDFKLLGTPDIWLEDNDSYKLGKYKITALHSPGHAPGSMCFHVENILFSGDELYYRKVGDTREHPNSSFRDQVKSIKRLYRLLDNGTIVYPGHGRSTDIGSEKSGNQNISLTRVVQ